MNTQIYKTIKITNEDPHGFTNLILRNPLNEPAIKRLIKGNNRYVSGKLNKRNPIEERKNVLNGQNPEVMVVECSDSRVVAEYIFDAKLGEIFNSANAGNLVDDNITIGSIEYFVNHIKGENGGKVLIIMGHGRSLEGEQIASCGAVSACCEAKGEVDEGKITDIAKSISPVARENNWDIKDTTIGNIIQSILKIPEKSQIIENAMRAGILDIVAAYYEHKSGMVRFLTNL